VGLLESLIRLFFGGEVRKAQARVDEARANLRKIYFDKWGKYTEDELRRVLGEYHLSISGNKNDMINRLIENEIIETKTGWHGKQEASELTEEVLSKYTPEELERLSNAFSSLTSDDE
jgi:hypothetical protein